MNTLSTYAKRRIRRVYPSMDGEPFVNQTFRRFEGWRCVSAISRPTDLEALAATGVEKVQLGVPQGFVTGFPDFFLDELIPKPKLPPGLKLTYPSFEALKLALSAEYEKARSSAKTYDWKFIRPRRRQMIACDEHGARCHFCDEAVEWDGTLGDLVRFSQHAQQHGAAEIYIEGGFDGSDYFDFGDYTPTDEFYGVTAVKIEGTKHEQSNAGSSREAGPPVGGVKGVPALHPARAEGVPEKPQVLQEEAPGAVPGHACPGTTAGGPRDHHDGGTDSEAHVRGPA